jgi:hypothetical protein
MRPLLRNPILPSNADSEIGAGTAKVVRVAADSRVVAVAAVVAAEGAAVVVAAVAVLVLKADARSCGRRRRRVPSNPSP